jgi:hypothetical protein
MANGRLGIPLERARDLAAILDLDAAEFCLAVIEQRAPSVYAALQEELDVSMIASLSDEKRSAVRLIAEARSISHRHVEVIAEVVVSPDPTERWLAPVEVPIVALIRRHYPGGLGWMELEPLKKGIELHLETDH